MNSYKNGSSISLSWFLNIATYQGTIMHRGLILHDFLKLLFIRLMFQIMLTVLELCVAVEGSNHEEELYDISKKYCQMKVLMIHYLG